MPIINTTSLIEVMAPMVADLSDQDMVDLAAYYAYLPRLPGYHPTPGVAAPSIVVHGAPMRNIPPCAACHGGLDIKTGSPWLEGESPAYLKAQLQAFASGTRHNDISDQMRNIARQMTPDEIEAAAQYWGDAIERAGTHAKQTKRELAPQRSREAGKPRTGREPRDPPTPANAQRLG